MITKKHKPTAQEKRWHGWLADQPCCNCGSQIEVCIHHCAGASAKHNKVHIGQAWVLPLCWECHQGVGGIHQSRARFDGGLRKEIEKRLFAELIEDVARFDIGLLPSDEQINAIEGYVR